MIRLNGILAKASTLVVLTTLWGCGEPQLPPPTPPPDAGLVCLEGKSACGST